MSKKTHCALFSISYTHYMRAFLLIPILFSCGQTNVKDTYTGTTPPPAQIRSIDPRLLAAVETFEANWGRQISFPVEVQDLNSGTVGVCISWTNGARHVKVDSDAVRTYSSEKLEQVVMHELGHCALNRGHLEAVITWSWTSFAVPYSVMHPYVFNDLGMEAYRREKTHYISELYR